MKATFLPAPDGAEDGAAAMPVPPPPITAAPAGAHRHDGMPWDAHFIPSERTKEGSPAPPKQVLHPRTPQAEHEEAARVEAARVEAQRQERACGCRQGGQGGQGRLRRARGRLGGAA